MRQFRRLAVFVLLVSSFFMTGCDVAQIMDVVGKIANGVQQAMPAVKQVVDAFGQVANNNQAPADNAQAANNNNEQAAANNANVATIDPNAENVGNAAAAPAANNQAAAPAGNATTARVSSSIRALLGSTRFRGAEVDGGNLACAQVVSTALKNAGVLSRVSLNCDQVVADLRAVGWRAVQVPPYQDGDVVTWTTKRGPGRHIGIIVKQGSTFQAISNNSDERMPKVHAINYMPITQVLRKV